MGTDAGHRPTTRAQEIAEQRGLRIGASKPSHLDDAVAAVQIRLSAEETASLEEPYRPHAVLGHC